AYNGALMADTASDGHDHDHGGHGGHHHSLARTPEARIQLALAITVGSMALSLVGGALAHSLALLTDAAHMLVDAGALLLALWAQRLAVRPRTILRTYGSRRAETLAAFANAILLAVTSLWIMGEAVARWRSTPEVQGGIMLVFGVLG